jgi:capsule polysaccharide export protein KpsC/LpsZ
VYLLGTRLTSYSLKTRITILSRQIPSEASVVRQPKKVYCEMIGMGAEAITIVRAVTADLFCDY